MRRVTLPGAAVEQPNGLCEVSQVAGLELCVGESAATHRLGPLRRPRGRPRARRRTSRLPAAAQPLGLGLLVADGPPRAAHPQRLRVAPAVPVRLGARLRRPVAALDDPALALRELDGWSSPSNAEARWQRQSNGAKLRLRILLRMSSGAPTSKVKDTVGAFVEVRLHAMFTDAMLGWVCVDHLGRRLVGRTRLGRSHPESEATLLGTFNTWSPSG
mmetsp:Transcript_121227/g.387321  ORF Transcript_121227/g.387321 Transcript_121227/m.387321 type:complete len:216 (-) Transcript_121227:13-660(-)